MMPVELELLNWIPWKDVLIDFAIWSLDRQVEGLADGVFMATTRTGRSFCPSLQLKDESASSSSVNALIQLLTRACQLSTRRMLSQRNDLHLIHGWKYII